ncbi:hypothetical protein FRC02_008183 [Tulasnella sp. 418]|nr:hypothetical protein FRC02_008183 [Tulasnella sp. 418]
MASSSSASATLPPSPTSPTHNKLSSKDGLSSRASSLIRRSATAVQELFPFPFTSGALATLPQNPEGIRERAPRNDNIPDAIRDSDGHLVSYQSVDQGVNVRVPKKIATPIKVEAKVWFANERTWISYLNVAILLGTLSAALYNSSHDVIARRFAYVYALISLGILGYGYVVYQKRVTLIRRRDPGHFDEVVGPVLICVALFVAVLSNFIIRVREYQKAPHTP